MFAKFNELVCCSSFSLAGVVEVYTYAEAGSDPTVSGIVRIREVSNGRESFYTMRLSKAGQENCDLVPHWTRFKTNLRAELFNIHVFQSPQKLNEAAVRAVVSCVVNSPWLFDEILRLPETIGTEDKCGVGKMRVVS